MCSVNSNASRKDSGLTHCPSGIQRLGLNTKKNMVQVFFLLTVNKGKKALPTGMLT